MLISDEVAELSGSLAEAAQRLTVLGRQAGELLDGHDRRYADLVAVHGAEVRAHLATKGKLADAQAKLAEARKELRRHKRQAASASARLDRGER